MINKSGSSIDKCGLTTIEVSKVFLANQNKIQVDFSYSQFESKT
jgi:hypothetical protein